MSEFAEGYAVGQNSNNGYNGMCGGWGEWIWIIVLFALWGGGNGFGFGGGMRGDYATQSDLAMGFNNSAVLGGLNDLKLGQCQGFAGVERSLGDISHQISDCCCATQRAIDNSTREILGFLTQDKISTLTAENQALKFQQSQSNQNAYLTATIDASRAELIRRLGAEYPAPAYIVQPPTPVAFPYGYGGYGYNGNYGCGCGC